ncbi:hypothetical protein D3C81_1513100 [compost metagenome]
MKLSELRQLANRKQQLTAEPHLQKAAQTRMHIGNLQQCKLTKGQVRLLHCCGQSILGIKKEEYLYHFTGLYFFRQLGVMKQYILCSSA